MIEWDLAIGKFCEGGVEVWGGGGIVEYAVGADEVWGEGPGRWGGRWRAEKEVDEEGAGEG